VINQCLQYSLFDNSRCFQIGDLLMCYILKHSSIFLCVKKNDYFQVTGRPLNVVLQKPIFASSMERDQEPCSKKGKCSMVKNCFSIL
jgi:telomerase reverse transcriptase